VKKRGALLSLAAAAFLGLLWLATSVAFDGEFFTAHFDPFDAIASVRRSHEPRFEINFSSLYGDHGQFEVLHPLLNLQKLRLRRVDVACGDTNGFETAAASGVDALCTWARSESDEGDEIFLASDREKHQALDQLLTKHTPLPANFVETPPFIDSAGFSYAYFLVKREVAPFNQKAWVEQHLSLFKVSELREVLEKYQINDQSFKLISRLDETQVGDVVNGAPLVMTAEFVLIKDRTALAFSPLSYWVYDVSPFRVAAKEAGYTLTAATADSACARSLGNACWQYTPKSLTNVWHKISLTILAIAMVSLLSCLALYASFLLEQRRDERRRRLSLQVLSHEFRTPVSAMLLLSEQIAKHLHKFDTEDQDLMTRLSSEIFKMQRFVEVSRNYLQASQQIQVKRSVLSVNEWLSDVVADVSAKISFKPLEQSVLIYADEFWLRLVLTNLLQNAINHGAEPVNVHLEASGRKLKISIEDAGRCEFSSLKEMTEPFVKSRTSHGMGLGLNMVDFVARECGYELSFSPNPTTFSLTVQRNVERDSQGEVTI
jgi:signal transduction histidine kinase